MLPIASRREHAPILSQALFAWDFGEADTSLFWSLGIPSVPHPSVLIPDAQEVAIWEAQDDTEGTDFGQSRSGHPDLTNFGQSNFGQSIFGHLGFGPANFGQIQFLANPILANSNWIWVCVCHGAAQRVGPKPRKNRARRVGPRRGREQHFALFSLSPPTFSLFLYLSSVSSRGILVVFLKAGTLKCARLGSRDVV